MGAGHCSGRWGRRPSREGACRPRRVRCLWHVAGPSPPRRRCSVAIAIKTEMLSCLCCPGRWSLASCRCCALEMWSVWPRTWPCGYFTSWLFQLHFKRPHVARGSRIGQGGSEHLDLHLPLHPVPAFAIGETEARGWCRARAGTRIAPKARLGRPGRQACEALNGQGGRWVRGGRGWGEAGPGGMRASARNNRAEDSGAARAQINHVEVTRQRHGTLSPR